MPDRELVARWLLHGSDDVIDNDLILVWGHEKRIITGADLLGRLLRGIVTRDAARKLCHHLECTRLGAYRTIHFSASLSWLSTSPDQPHDHDLAQGLTKRGDLGEAVVKRFVIRQNIEHSRSCGAATDPEIAYRRRRSQKGVTPIGL